MKLPDWWQFTLLFLATYRIFRLIGDDEILNIPRRWFLRLGNWREEGDVVPPEYRKEWGKFLTCPYCLGFWVALTWWGGFQFSPKWACIAATPWAINQAAATLSHFISD